MTATLWIPGRLPGLNEIIAAAKGNGGRGYKYSKMKREWNDTIVLLIRAARLQPMDRVALAFEYRELSKRRDPDNIAGGARKLICDSLVAAGVLPDDGWDEIAGFTDTWRVDKTRPGVLVTLTTSP